ncbi:unnamed protein product, partial [Mesorhabditis belari]|uniref:Uncharacterized protein n=1 Tax=Mesorhabditis belari TaxID=2138241 RepID=A0AAF3J2W3_9BILA
MTEVKRHHKATRHIHKPHHLCKEPDDLKTQMALWLRESLMEGGVREEITLDEDWTPPQDQDPICEGTPDTGTDSSVMQRSLCPWQWRVNYDEAREPKIISEAHCICRRSRGGSVAFCLPIKREVPILRRAACDPVTGRWEYARATIPVTVGCHSVLPRSARATPLSQHYKTPIGAI